MSHALPSLLLALGCAAPVTSAGPADPIQRDSADRDTARGDTARGDTAAGDTGALEEVPGSEWSAPVYDPYALPDGVRTVDIEIDAEAMARLDADPFHAPDERGVFVDDDGVRHEVDLSYRGAYALLSVMRSYDLRNWKVKFDADDPYLDRREWNFNYEPHLRQKLAYDLLRFAGVAVPEAEHVVLRLNGVYQGVYLQYADPDNKAWLYDSFGDDDGDLYKAAYDLPYEPQCFADLTWLGDEDSAYACHYTKKTNDEEAPDDVAVLRAFLDDLNHLPDDEFAAWVEGAVDVESLLSYLAVSNFIAQWDSYPQRPKNYWLYEDRHAGRMAFIPWDLDNTFSPSIDGTYNKMGATAPVLYNLVESDYAPVHAEEGTERPLVRRLFAREEVQEAYLARYAVLSESILSQAYLDDRLTALHEIVGPYASATDQGRMASAREDMRTFLSLRAARVAEELEAMR